jgi:hypothetical protein
MNIHAILPSLTAISGEIIEGITRLRRLLVALPSGKDGGEA